MQTLLTVFRLSLLFILAFLYFNFTIYAQIGTPTPSLTPTPTQTSTNTPVPAVEAVAPENEPTNMLGPEQPKEDTTYGPHVPKDFIQKQSQQQQSNQGDVKSAFSQEDGPGNILDSKPNDSTGAVIKIFVTVIALTVSGVVGWMAIKSNAKVEVDQKSEDPITY